MLTGGTEWTEKRNVDWRNSVDWKAECLVEEKFGLESGMLTGGTERSGVRNIDWRNRVDWK